MQNFFSKKVLLITSIVVVVFLVIVSIKYKSPINFSNLFARVLVTTTNTPITAEPEFSLPGTSTSIAVGKQYTENAVYSLGGKNPIYGLSVYGNVEFKSDDSVVRIILVTNKGEKLVAEFYPLIFEDMQVNDFSVCEETCALDGETPKELRIEVNNANLSIDSLYIIDSYKKVGKSVKEKGISSYNREIKNKQDKVKIKTINAMATKKNKTWLAGETDISAMSYSQKQKMYGQSKFPAGIEYYVGGIMPAGTTTTTTSTTNTTSVASSSQYAPDWDWRNRHGINWITSTKNQGSCGSCWAFASAGAVEAEANLYFNNILNLDLSEQDILSCSSGGGCTGGYPSTALNYVSSTGIVDEAAFPYTATNNMCSNKSNDSAQLIKNGGKIDFGVTPYTATEDNLKKMLIQYGPLSAGLLDWSHAMTLVGWKTVKEGDRFFYRNISSKATIWYSVPAGSPLIGKSVWIFKNSWGNTWGDSGFIYVETNITNFAWTHALKSPVQSLKQAYIVNCTDTDQDGYYWWGLGPKPATCPANSKAAEDGDDSNPSLGSIDSYGNFVNTTNHIPYADFTSDKVSVTQSSGVMFNDLSTDSPTSWLWNFEGGNPSTSTEKDPTVTYYTPGVYDVSLTATNSSGSSTKTSTDYVSVSPKALYGNISISSNPIGASVFVDGVSKGVTPVSLTNISAGSYNIKLTKPGYQSYTSTISVAVDQTVELNPTLIQTRNKRK